ncbi:alpha/beta hydrolase [Puniceicoccaceae bacterium K14]|nr:alpha/beta hydrolase [Puniceicoccaceae bacterium K14]
MQKRNQKIDDLDIVEFGALQNGPRVIFLHGGPGAYGYMETFCHSFSSYCNAVYYEQRGSKQGDYNIGVEDHIRDLGRVVDHYSQESKPIIVGHSWGSMLAVLFAGRRSESLKKVILTGCGPLNKTQGDEFLQTLNVRFGDKKDYYDRLWDAIDEEKDELKQQSLANKYIDNIMEIYQMDPNSGLEIQPRHWDYKGSYRTMCESDEYVSKNEHGKALEKIETSLTVIHGTYDVLSPESLFRLVRKHVSHVKTYALERAGHYPWAGPRSDEFLKILKQEVT